MLLVEADDHSVSDYSIGSSCKNCIFNRAVFVINYDLPRRDVSGYMLNFAGA